MPGAGSQMALSSLTSGIDKAIVCVGGKSMFKQVVACHTPFQIEQRTYTMNNANLGTNDNRSQFLRAGDMVSRAYLKAVLPALTPTSSIGTTTTFAYMNGAQGATTVYNNIYQGVQPWLNPVGGGFVAWVNAVGYAMIKEVRAEISNSCISVLQADYLFMLEELSGAGGRKLYDSIGRFSTLEQQIAYAVKGYTLWVPLPFWFSAAPSNSLSLATISLNPVELSFDFNPVTYLVKTSNIDVLPFTGGALLTNSSLTLAVVVEYIFLEKTERLKFAKTKGYDLLIETVQTMAPWSIKDTTTASKTITFKHPVKQLVWATFLKANENGRNWFNYSSCGPPPFALGNAATGAATGGNYHKKPALPVNQQGTFDIVQTDPLMAGIGPSDSSGPYMNATLYQNGQITLNDLLANGNGTTGTGFYNMGNIAVVNADILATIEFKINNTPRLEQTPAAYFRLVDPWARGQQAPQSFVYSYSFSFLPNAPYATGHFNFSRVDAFEMILTLNTMEGTTTAFSEFNMIMYARGWNVLSHERGVAGLAYI